MIKARSTAHRSGGAVADVCRRLGISDRHLRRVFEAKLGVSPTQYLLTQRLLNAKQLIADTSLKISEVADASGFGSVRRFNDAFAQRYGMRPSEMRKRPATSIEWPQTVTTTLRWRPPVDVDRLMSFLQARAIDGMEHIERDEHAWVVWRTVALNTPSGRQCGWIRAHISHGTEEVRLSLSERLQAFLPEVTWRVRHWLDLDADPLAISDTLLRDFVGEVRGLRLPGAIDGFELGVRAVLGQQVSVKAARTLAGRLVVALGDVQETPHSSIYRTFPSPQAVLDADPVLLGRLGLTRQRQSALKALASAVCDSALELSPAADAETTRKALLDLPGIGPWTAAYIVMRALHWPDVWLTGDLVLKKALLDMEQERLDSLPSEGVPWAPWRSYAVMAIWGGLLRGTKGTHP